MESIRIARTSSPGAFYLSFPEEPAGDATMRVAADIFQRSSLLNDILAEATAESPCDGGEDNMFSTCRGGAVVYSPPGYLRSWIQHVTTPSWIEAASVAQLLFVLQASVFLGDDAAARDLRTELLRHNTGDGSLDPYLRHWVTDRNKYIIGPEWLSRFLKGNFPFLHNETVPQILATDWIDRHLKKRIHEKLVWIYDKRMLEQLILFKNEADSRRRAFEKATAHIKKSRKALAGNMHSRSMADLATELSLDCPRTSPW